MVSRRRLANRHVMAYPVSNSAVPWCAPDLGPCGTAGLLRRRGGEVGTVDDVKPSPGPHHWHGVRRGGEVGTVDDLELSLGPQVFNVGVSANN